MENRSIKITDPNKALEKARSYCQYQEQNHQEVKEKLYGWGLHKKDVEEIMAALVTEGFLNEERFAATYAGGKFRIKKWGKQKIKLALKQKKVSDYSINKALKEIDDHDYRKTLRAIITKKQKEIKEPVAMKKKYKIAQYLLSRGYEKEMIWEALGEEE